MSASPPCLTIVHVVFSSRIAGGEQHCIDLAQAQAARGHQVHVVGPTRSAVAQAVGPTLRYHGMALPVLRGLRLRRLVRTLDAHVCHAHLGTACKAAAQADAVARIGTLHVGFKAHHHDALDGLICVNKAQQKQLHRYPGHARVIHNWAPECTPTSTGTDLRAELGLRPEQLLVGSVGRLHPSKGMDLLVSAFKGFAPPDAVLAILGEGKDMQALRRLALGDPRIHLLGFRKDVDAAMAGMDLFVSPSREEAFPLAILEAMRAKLPIIASATQGPKEMLAQQPATLVPVGDVVALGHALQTQLAALRAVPRAQRRVSYDTSAYVRADAVEHVLTFYREVLARRAMAPVERAETAHAAMHV